MFAVYWTVKFCVVLPAEAKLTKLNKDSESFVSFSRDLLENTYFPESSEHYKDIVNYYMVKINKVFPGSTIFVFEREGEAWKLATFLRSSKSEVNVMSVYKWDVFDRAASYGDLTHVNLESAKKNRSGTIEFFKDLETENLIIFPFMNSEKGYERLFILGLGGDEEELRRADVYLKFFFLHINSIYRVSAKNILLKKENEHLHNELNALLKELDAAGSRLIQRTKERKALKQVVTYVVGRRDIANPGCSSILSVIAKFMEIDVAACLTYDETNHALSVYTGTYGVDEKDYYSLKLDNLKSSSVRVFTTGKPFMSNDAQNDSEIIKEYTRKWGINSLMVLPIRLRGKIIGVLRLGSRQRGFFNQEQMEFASIISDEIGVVLETHMLLENVANKAKELAHLNSVKDEFLSTVSHELKTPLTTIKGFLDVVTAGEAGPLNPRQKEFFTIINNAADRLHHLVSDLLDISRLSGRVEMVMEEIDLKSVAGASIANLQMKAKEKNIAIRKEMDPFLPKITADGKWISQVLDNLLMNAVKFSPLDSEVKVVAKHKGEAVMVSVIDNGPGIPAEEKQHVFDKFFRGKSNSGGVPGTGLGLAICKSVVEKHGGRIWVESGENKGAKFFFALPVKKKDKNRGNT